MARPPKPKLVDATFRCLDEEDFTFPGKMEYLGHDAGEEPDGTRIIRWVQNQSRANCPHDETHSFELVELRSPPPR
jgi:hypothetical protein